MYVVVTKSLQSLHLPPSRSTPPPRTARASITVLWRGFLLQTNLNQLVAFLCRSTAQLPGGGKVAGEGSGCPGRDASAAAAMSTTVALGPWGRVTVAEAQTRKLIGSPNRQPTHRLPDSGGGETNPQPMGRADSNQNQLPPPRFRGVQGWRVNPPPISAHPEL